MKLFMVALIMSWRALAEAIQLEGQRDVPSDEPNAWQSLASRYLQPVADNHSCSSNQSPATAELTPWQRLAQQMVASPLSQQPSEDLDDHQDVDKMSLLSAGSDYPMTEGDHHEQEPEEVQGQVVAAAPGVCSEDDIRKILADAGTVSTSRSNLLAIVNRSMKWSTETCPAPSSNRYSKLANAVMYPGSTWTGIKDLANQSDRNRRTLPHDLQRLASSLVWTERVQRNELERQISSYDKSCLLLFCEAPCYDETPMPVVVSELPTQIVMEEISESLPMNALVNSETIAVPTLPLAAQDAAKLPIKLMQSEQKFAMLVRLPEQGGQSAPFAIFIGDSISWLQRLESTTGLVTMLSQERVSAVSEYANSFQRRWRSTCTDKASSNQSAERQLLARRGPGWRGFQWFCEVHVVATCFEHTFSPMELFISGLINSALSLNFGSHILRFRNLVRTHILSHIIWRDTPLAISADTWKMHVLRIFMRTGRKKNYRMALLLKLAPGDWRNRSGVEVFLKPGEDPNTVARLVADGLSMGLVSSKFNEWPRHRWKGADIAVNQFGLLDAVHGILSWVYPLFIESFKPAKKNLLDSVEPMAAVPEAEAAGAAPVAAGLCNPAGECADASGDLALVAPGELRGDYLGPQLVQSEAFTTDAAAANKRFRTKGLAFVHSNPGANLIMTRLIMEPFRELLDQKLYIGSKRYELHQQAQSAAEQLSGSPAVPWPYRDFALGEAAKNTAENRFFTKLGALLDPSMWISIPSSHITEAQQAACFDGMSRAGCMVEEFLRSKHLLSPYNCFHIVWDESAGPRIYAIDSCLHDPTIKELIDEFGEALGNDESRMVIMTVLLISRCDVSNLESLHAWIRRMIHQRVQTHGLCMEDLSALWCLARHRLKLPPDMVAPDLEQKQDEACPEDLQPPLKKPKAANSTNSWNLFCRYVSRPGGARRYKALYGL
jgi:hypothetical protein